MTVKHNLRKNLQFDEESVFFRLSGFFAYWDYKPKKDYVGLKAYKKIGRR